MSAAAADAALDHAMAAMGDFARRCLAQFGQGGEIPDERLREVTLLPHQVDGARRLQAILDRHGGALLADEVGLGKTYTALAVARRFSPVLVVAPSAVRSMWRDACERCGIPATIVSYEQLSAGRVPSGAHRALLILDEAHRARTPGTRRYQALARLAIGARVLLLTATPIHNRRRDLESLLALFLGAGAASLDDATLGALIVRHRAEDIGARLPVLGALLRHPLPPAPQVLRAVRALPPPLPPADGGVAASLVALQLSRAWCSSDAALLAALRARLATAAAIEHALTAGRHPNRRDLAAWSADRDGSVQLAFPEFIAPHASAHDVAPLLDVVRRHADALRALGTLVRTDAARDGDRFDALRRILASCGERRAVIFTHSVETADAAFRAIRHTSRAALLTGRGACIASGAIPREELLAEFAPAGTPGRRRDHLARIDVLVASDVLSEGIDLQRAAVVIHLDLPWTVARFEQRLGRLRRLGSVHDAVEAHLIAPPVDAEELGATLRLLARKARLVTDTIGRSSILLGAEAWAVPPAGADHLAPTVARSDILHALRRLERLARTCAPGVSASPAHARVPVRTLDAPVSLALARLDGEPHLVVSRTGGVTSDPSAVLGVLAHCEQLLWAGACTRATMRPPASVSGEATAVTPAEGGARVAAGDAHEEYLAVERAIVAWCAHRSAERHLVPAPTRDSRAHRDVLRALASIVSRAPRARRAFIAGRAAEARGLALWQSGAGAERVLARLAGAAPDASPGARERPGQSVRDDAWLDDVLATLRALPARDTVPAAGCAGPATAQSLGATCRVAVDAGGDILAPAADLVPPGALLDAILTLVPDGDGA